MRLIFLIILFLTVFKLNAQKILNDFSFTLHEETVNKVLLALGEIKGTNDYEVMFIRGKYHWKVLNPEIQIRPDSSQFICDAHVNVGPFNYKTKVNGDVKISYNKAADKIEIKITRAIFELYTVIIDKKFHIKDIHLEEYFKDPFLFDGPRSYGTSMDVSLPDSVVKKIYIQPSECDLKINWQKVTADCEIMVSNKPFLPNYIKPQISPSPAKTTKPSSVLPPKTNTVAPQKK